MPPTKDPDLHLMSLRLSKRDIAVARKEGKRRKMPYQRVLRTWISQCADIARRAKVKLVVSKRTSKRIKAKAKSKA